MKANGPEIGNIALKDVFDRKGLDPSLLEAYDRMAEEVGEQKGVQKK
ncbi:MAG: hypothetical protein AB8G77_23435 [Rhodothermales bacterium]